MVDFRVTLTVPSNVDGVGYIADENGILADVQDGSYLLSDGVSLVDPLPVFDAGGPSYLDSLGHRKASIPLNLSGVIPDPDPPDKYGDPEDYADSPAPEGFRWAFVTHNGVVVTFNGEPVVHLEAI